LCNRAKQAPEIEFVKCLLDKFFIISHRLNTKHNRKSKKCEEEADCGEDCGKMYRQRKIFEPLLIHQYYRRSGKQEDKAAKDLNRIKI
jgi:hypothetical protein